MQELYKQNMAYLDAHKEEFLKQKQAIQDQMMKVLVPSLILISRPVILPSIFFLILIDSYFTIWI